MKKNILALVAGVVAINAFGSAGITRSSEVEKLCKTKSEELLLEQGITLNRWSAQHFNGERTFNIDGVWNTNAGRYLVECELPYGSDESVLTIELTKEK